MCKVGKASDGRQKHFDAGINAGILFGLKMPIKSGFCLNAGANAGIVGPVASCAGLAVYLDLGQFGLALGHSRE